ncbi:LamG domain-containing protein, partial [Klebsiella pneumoniae]|nr:LamG domain-containing protein [Klebsiella pneumoniae]
AAGNILRIYSNGTLSSTTDIVDGAIDNGTYKTYLGADPPGTRYFKGLMDDVRIYNRVIDAAEVTALYNSGNGCVSGTPTGTEIA